MMSPVASRRMLTVSVTALALLLVMVGTAIADTTYVPWPRNNQKVYLSQSCHDRGTGSCQENVGCSGHMGENAWSDQFAYASLRDGSGAGGLLDREYIVRLGDGLTSQNISNSNAWGALMHIPLHSNAVPWDCTSPYDASRFGTWGMYVSSSGRQLADRMQLRIGQSSPGTNDKVVYRSDLGELNQTSAVAGYLEAEFHTYGQGWRWLHDYESWDWRLGYAVDECRGYPRASNGGNPTGTKHCSW